MSVLEKLVSKVEELCKKIETQKEELKNLKISNEELKHRLEQKEEELSRLLIAQSGEEQKLEAIFHRIDDALVDLHND
ncbi:hypothetical protein BBW65_02905 [Helicobacter enhydrae]|uniref:DUF904 domain-containing protein n=1 Tax=Helicobacter enhydrae TaxID=222136 RepID=A0A1B1U4Y4_9HELI|nr:hypothetical protein [Helicobacter enhydrae]ANV97816.1 hypothetical protein BBW65_02905 [Helicobacter enhydrae]